MNCRTSGYFGTDGTMTMAVSGPSVAVLRGRQLPGGAYVAWLLDVRLGKRVGPVPVASFVDSFGRPDSMALNRALAMAEGKLRPEDIGVLRTPRVPYAAKEAIALYAA